jgi:predicted DNA-binding protein
MENENKSYKQYTFTLPLELSDEFDALIRSEHKRVSEYVRSLIVTDLKQQKLL